MDRPKSFFACDSSAPVRVEHEGGTAAWLPGTLVVTSVQDTGCLRLRSNSLIRVFFRASCCWPSEGLFSQSFSIAPSIQALRRLPCLGAFSDVWQVRHIEGSPWLGSYSAVQCLRRLMGQPLYSSAADAAMWGDRDYGDGSNPLRMTQQYHLASMAAWISSTGISHQDLLPHIPSICLSAVNSSPRPAIAP